MKTQRIIACMLAASVLYHIAFGGLPVVYGEEAPVLIETDSVEDIVNDGGADETNSYHPLSYEVPSVKPAEAYEIAPLTAGLQERYDSRDRAEQCITSVKNQGNYGTCWAFAAINSAEADLILDGRLPAASADLSEAQLAYFFYHRLSDPLGGTDGDIVSPSRNYLSLGGNNQLSTFALATWISPSEETVMEYGRIGSYTGANVQKDMAYASDAAHLQNSYWISMSDEDVLKEMIMRYGAVATSYYSDSDYYTGDEQYYYYPVDTGQNHAVSIVGWDDTIPAERFTVTVNGSTYRPSRNGGWLIKNSYGANWGRDGYFWLSYEDRSLLNSQNMGVVFDYEAADNYDNNYQYDGTVSLSRLFYKSLTSCYNANVFTTQAEETLEAVGFYTTEPGMGYRIQVYRNVTEGSPLGIPVFTSPVAGTAEYAGYHTVSLGQGIELNAGETYSVVVQYINAAGGVSFFIDKSVNFGWMQCISANQTGQGYFSANGTTWQDCAEEQNANIRIKAFTNYRSANGTKPTVIPTAGISFERSTYSLSKNQKLTLTVLVQPENATNQGVTWSSSNSVIAEVSTAGVVTAKSEGTAIITARTDAGGHKTVCQVTVTDPTRITGIQAASVNISLNEQRRLDVVLAPASASRTNLSFSSSNPSVVTVSGDGVLTGITPGTAVITIASKNSSVKTTVQVTVYSPTQSFCVRLYEKCLGRQAEADGLAYWNQMLVSKKKSGAQTGYGFVFSEEYENKQTSDEDYIEMLYQVFMDRPSDAEGKAYWLSILDQGVSREYVYRGFAHSQEYTNICNAYGIERGSVTLTQARDKNPNLTAFVNRIYEKAMGRNGDAEGLNYWCSTIQGGRKNPVQVAEYFITSQEFRNKNLSNAEYVKVLYRTFMGRECDQEGLNYWLGELNRGSSRETVLRRFAGCPEFKNIMASFGL